eukprot:g45.t1
MCRDACRLSPMAAPLLTRAKWAHGLAGAKKMIQEDLRRGTWPEPKKQRCLMEMLARLDGLGAQCKIEEGTRRKCILSERQANCVEQADLDAAVSSCESLLQEFMSLLEDSCFRVRKAAAAFLSLLGHCSGSHSKLEISRSFCHALHRETSSEPRTSARKTGLSSNEMLREPTTAAGYEEDDARARKQPVEPVTQAQAMNSLATLEDFEDKEAIQATLGVVNRRQEEQLGTMAAELAHIQWKLVRDQSSSLAKELAIVQTQLKDLKAESRRALLECERAFRENEAKLNEERGLRLAMFESLELRMKKVRADVDVEAQERAAADAEVTQKLKALSEEQSVRLREQQAQDLQLRRLREDLKELGGLKESVSHHRSKLNEADHSLNAMSARFKDHELQHHIDDELQKRTDSVQKLDTTVKELGTALEAEVATRQSLAEEVDQVLKSMKSKVKSLVCEQGEISRQAMESARKQLQEQLDRESKAREAVQGKLQSAFEGLASEIQHAKDLRNIQSSMP